MHKPGLVLAAINLRANIETHTFTCFKRTERAANLTRGSASYFAVFFLSHARVFVARLVGVAPFIKVFGTRVVTLSCGAVRMTTSLAVLIEYRPVTDVQTDGRTDTRAIA